MNKVNSRHPIYRSWQHMKSRCETPSDPKYHRYGSRGITYCDTWKVFNNFYDDMMNTWKPGLTLNRKDNDGHYNKENCNWADQIEQNRNKSSNKITQEQADEIRRLCKKYSSYRIKFHYQTEIGNMFGISRRMVDYIEKCIWRA